MDKETIDNPYESVSMKVAEDAVPVCPVCLEPCDPLGNYCPNCDSNEAINPLASYLPFESIRFKAGMFGKMWHKAWDSNTPLGLKCLYICLFILFMPLVFLMLLTCARYQYLFGKKRFQKQENTSLSESEK
ncbi:MAG: hypothetical protein ACYSOH_05700 [Planctomycetota bacterium]|jgi:hypothetical protein